MPLVQLHRRLLLLPAVVLVLRPEVLYFGLELLHGSHVFDLPYRERKQSSAHEHRKEDDAQPPRRAQGVERFQRVTYEVSQWAEDPPQKVCHLILSFDPAK